jgi:hypothetical protein
MRRDERVARRPGRGGQMVRGCNEDDDAQDALTLGGMLALAAPAQALAWVAN